MREKDLLRGTEVNRHPWELARVELLESWLLRTELGSGAILDIGCGDAFVLRSISARFPGRKFIGVDTALSDTCDRLDISEPSVVSSLDHIPAGLKVAAIFLMDVLEHVEDPQSLLEDLKSRGLLTAQTFVFITVPASPMLFSQHDIFLGHFRRYTLRSLKALTDQVGLASVEAGNLFFSLFIVRLLQCGLEVVRPHEFKGLSAWSGGPFLTKMIVGALLLDVRLARLGSAWLRRDIPGLSCYSICRIVT